MFPNETCATATPITSNGTLFGETIGANNDIRYQSSTGCALQSGIGGPDLVYSVNVPSMNRLTAVVRASLPDAGSGWDAVVNFIPGAAAACGAPLADGGFGGQTCVVNADEPDEPTNPLVYVNTTMSAQNVFVIIDGYGTGANNNGAFSLTTDVVPAPVGELCENAEVLTLPANRAADTLVGYGDNYRAGSGCASGTTFADRVYRVSVPGNNRLTATAVAATLPDGGATFNPTVNLVTAATCTSTLTCATGAAGVAGTAAAVYDNLGTAAQDVLVVVDTGSAAPGSYSLNVTAAPQMFLPGEFCGNTAAAITTPTMLTGQPFTGYSDNYNLSNEGTTCFFDSGPDRVYAVTVNAMTRLRAIGTSSGNLSISVVDGAAAACAASPVTCATRADATGAGGTETAVFDNSTASAKTVFVIVDRTAGMLMTDTFDLGIDLVPVPPTVVPGLSCAMPTVLAPTGTFISNTTGIMGAYSFSTTGNCVGQSSMTNAPDGVFQITIPPNSTTTVTTRASWDMVLNVVDSPATNCGTGMGMGIVCAVPGSDTFGNEVIAIPNATMNPRVVFVILDGWDDTAFGPVEIETATAVIPPAAYTKTTIAGSCDMLGAPTVLLSSATMPTAGDEVASPTTAVPFAFNFFGAPASHFAADSNGLLHFFGSSMGTPTISFSNATIPTASGPNGFAAPFWDDQNSTATGGGTTSIRYGVVGMAPNRRLVVEWFDSVIFAASTSRLGYQVKLYETTNVIEFHYCTLTVGSSTAARLSGSSATVGLENATGTAGSLHSFNTANSVDTMNALRFTP